MLQFVSILSRWYRKLPDHIAFSQIAKTCLKDFYKNFLLQHPRPRFVFIYFQHFLSKSTLDMCEWYSKRVWNHTDCFPIPFYALLALSISHEHKYFATFSLEGAIQKGESDGGENSQVEYKNYLSYAHFLSSSFPSMGKGRALIIKWFFRWTSSDV